MFQPTEKIGVGGLEISGLEKELVMQALRNNRLSAGPFVAEFETEMARLHGRKFGVMCNSGTGALQIALATLKEVDGWRAGDEVLVPALSFIATSNAVLYNGLRPVFVDIDPHYYTMDPERLEERITERTRAIIPAHLFGLPCAMDRIVAVAQKYRLRIIEDSCEAMFVRYQGRPVGAFGDLACFSTYVAHIITTGIGGLAITDNIEHRSILRSLVSHGRNEVYITMDDDRRADPEALFDVVDRRFSFVRLGHSFRVTELEGALGLGQLARRDEIIKRRREHADYLTAGLRPLAAYLQLPSEPDDAEHAFMMYPLLLKSPAPSRRALVKFLESRLIETRYMLPLLNQPIYRQLFGDIERAYPVAEHINRTGFYIGCHPYLSRPALDYVIDTFFEFFNLRRGSHCV
jgi:dTDP-4-amino-4,6-dideoxygalactose transaminase